MKNSKYFEELEAAREFEATAKRMFNYATEPEIIDAACHFMKGAEIMQQNIASRAVTEQKQLEKLELLDSATKNTMETTTMPQKSFLKKILGGIVSDNNKA